MERNICHDLFHNARSIMIPTVFLALLVLFAFYFKSIFIVVFLFVLGCVSTIYKRFIHFSVGFELITFALIYYSYTIGSAFAIIAGIIMVFIASMLSGRVCIPMIIHMVVYFILILFMVLFKGLSIQTYGYIFVIMFNILLHFIYVFIMQFNFMNSITSFLINVIINFWMVGRFL